MNVAELLSTVYYEADSEQQNGFPDLLFGLLYLSAHDNILNRTYSAYTYLHTSEYPVCTPYLSIRRALYTSLVFWPLSMVLLALLDASRVDLDAEKRP